MRVFCTFCLQHQSQISNCLHYIQNYLSIFQTFLLPLLQIFGEGCGENPFSKKVLPTKISNILFIYFGETAAADKLSQERIAGHPLVVHILKIFKEFNQAVCRNVVRTVGRHFLECGQSVFFQHAKLVSKRGVVNVVATLLERVNPLKLAATNAVPHLERALGGGTAVLFVAHYATKQTNIRVADWIVHVKIHLELRRNKNLVFLVLWYGVTQLIVKGVYSLDDDRRIGRYLRRNTVFRAPVAELING